MSPNDDDLSAFHDDPLFRALTGPGTPEELAGEAEVLAGFTAAVPVRRGRRFAGRVGVVSSAIGFAAVMSGGAAAAYSGSLPDPVQQFAHDVFGVIGVDPPADSTSTATTDHPATPLPTTRSVTSAAPVGVTTPTASHPAARHHHVVARPTRKPAPTHAPTPSPSPTSTPVAVTTPTPTPTPTPTQTVPVPSDSITISLSRTVVSPGETVTAYGQLATATGDPIAGQDVWLIERSAGASTVAEVAAGTTGADGSVSLGTPPITGSVRLRLVTGTKVKSAPIAVIVQPSIQVSVGDDQGTEASILVTTTGAEPDDVVDILVRSGGRWQPFASSQLDSNGQAVFGATPPTGARPDHYRAVLPRTRAHAVATASFTVAPA